MKAVVLMGAFPADTSHLTPLADRANLIVYGTSNNPGYSYDTVPPEECEYRDFRRIGPTSRGHILWAYPGLGRALDEDEPDVLHVISEPWGFLAMSATHWAKTHPNTALVIHACDTIWWHGSKPEQMVRRALVNRMIDRVDAYVAENAMAIGLAEASGLEITAIKENIHTNPRDPDVFRPPVDDAEKKELRRQLGLPEEGVGIGFLGRLVPEKGPLLLLDALQQVRGGEEPVWAAIAGRGPLENEIRGRCATPDRIFLGELNYPEDVSRYMRALDVLAVPSWTTDSWEEQSPRVVIEAMMSGCVTVVARSGALPEMVGDAGLTFEQRDSNDLAKALERSVQPEVRASLSALARTYSVGTYSGPAIATRLFDVWERAHKVRQERVSPAVVRQPEAERSAPVKLLMVGEDLHGRGTERSVVRMLQHFDRSRIEPTLALVHKRGDFLADVPRDIRTIEISPETKRTSGAFTDILKLIAREKPDCVLGIHTSSSRLVALSRALRPGTPVICWEPDPFKRVEGEKGHYGIRRLLTSATHKLANVVLCPSDVVAEEAVAELKIPRRKVVVLPHPSVDQQVFDGMKEPVDEAPYGGDAPVIVNIGNMHGHKSQDVLLEAFARLRSKRMCSMVIIGQGPQGAALKAQAQSLGIADDVYFYGFRSNPFKYLAASDVFVSSAASEGFDISQVEAMACGVPVVVTDAPRFKIVEDGKTGLLVPPGDPNAIASAVERLLDDNELRSTVTEAALEESKNLSADKVTRRYEDLILALVGRAPRATRPLRIGHYYSDLLHPGGLPSDAHALIAAQLAMGDEVVGFGLGPSRAGVRGPAGMEYVFEERSPRGAWRLSQRIAKGPDRPDVLTVWSAINPGNEVILRAAYRAGIPTVITPHGVLTPKLYETGRAIPKRIYRRSGTAPSLRRWVDVLHAVSPQEERDARALGFRGPTHVFSFGTPPIPEIERPGPLRRDLGLGTDDVLIGFFGRMDVYQKGLDVVVAAFDMCRDLAENGDAVFVLAGMGSDEEWAEVQALIDDRALGKLVRTAGPFMGEERFLALADLDTLVHASRFDGITRVMRESAPLGVPTIATPEANAQLLVDVGASVMVELEAGEIAEAIRKAVSDPGWRKSASEAAKEWASRNRWHECAENFRAAYAEAERMSAARRREGR